MCWLAGAVGGSRATEKGSSPAPPLPLLPRLRRLPRLLVRRNTVPPSVATAAAAKPMPPPIGAARARVPGSTPFVRSARPLLSPREPVDGGLAAPSPGVAACVCGTLAPAEALRPLGGRERRASGETPKPREPASESSHRECTPTDRHSAGPAVSTMRFHRPQDEHTRPKSRGARNRSTPTHSGYGSRRILYSGCTAEPTRTQRNQQYNARYIQHRNQTRHDSDKRSRGIRTHTVQRPSAVTTAERKGAEVSTAQQTAAHCTIHEARMKHAAGRCARPSGPAPTKPRAGSAPPPVATLRQAMRTRQPRACTYLRQAQPLRRRCRPRHLSASRRTGRVRRRRRRAALAAELCRGARGGWPCEARSQRMRSWPRCRPPRPAAAPPRLCGRRSTRATAGSPLQTLL